MKPPESPKRTGFGELLVGGHGEIQGHGAGMEAPRFPQALPVGLICFLGYTFNLKLVIL